MNPQFMQVFHRQNQISGSFIPSLCVYFYQLLSTFELMSTSSDHIVDQVSSQWSTSAPGSLPLEMLLVCCYLNEPFSARILRLLLAHITTVDTTAAHVNALHSLLNIVQHICVSSAPLCSSRETERDKS